MTDTIEDQTHYMLAIEHLAAARLELAEAVKNEPKGLYYAFEEIDRAMKDIVMRVR